MSKPNNFRVIINLSNFFGDHRHRSRIFVNENIHTVQDLQDRICQIFEIRNFHLTSQNEYIPPSEDIRVLHNDEVLWVIPTRASETGKIPEKSQSPLSTKIPHTSERNQLNSTDKLNVTKKRKKSRPVPEDDETELINGIEDIEEEPVSKKKKKKKDKKSSGESVEDSPLIEETEGSKADAKSDICESASTSISFGGSSEEIRRSYRKKEPVPLITDQYLKEKKVNIVKINFVAGSVASLKENKGKDNREKEPECMETDRGSETEKLDVEEPANPVEESAVFEKVTEAASHLNGGSIQPPVNEAKENSGSLKQESDDKLSDLVSSGDISRKQTKTLPKPKFFKSPSWRKSPKFQKENQSETYLYPSGSLLTQFAYEKSSDGNTAEGNAATDNLNNQLEKKAQTPTSEFASSENVKPLQNIGLLPEPVPSIQQLKEISTSASYVDISSIAKERSLQDTFDESSMSMNGSETENNEKNSLGISGMRRIYSDRNSTACKRLSGVGDLLQELRTANSTTTSLDSSRELIDTTDFVTHRSRKRNRKRQKKSQPQESTYCATDQPTAPPRPMNVKGTPSIHIKFGEEEEPARESEEAENEIVVESKTIVDSESEDVRIEEEVILRSPLMTSLMPKVGDMIAFKILKLSSDYKPEMSSYITAKVLLFNGDTNNVYFEILGGLDQCQSPQGKFFMDIDEYEEPKSKNRMYLWNDLIEPRLLYP